MIDKNDPRLTAYVLGELNESEIREVTEAIEASDELKADVEELRETIGLLGTAYLSESNVALADEQRAVLKEAYGADKAADSDPGTSIQRKSIQLNERRFFRSRFFYSTLAIAAAILLMLFPLGAYQGSWFNDSGVALKSEKEIVRGTGRSGLAGSEGEVLEDEAFEDEAFVNGKGVDDMGRGRGYGERLTMAAPSSAVRESRPSARMGGVPISNQVSPANRPSEELNEARPQIFGLEIAEERGFAGGQGGEVSEGGESDDRLGFGLRPEADPSTMDADELSLELADRPRPSVNNSMTRSLGQGLEGDEELQAKEARMESKSGLESITGSTIQRRSRSERLGRTALAENGAGDATLDFETSSFDGSKTTKRSSDSFLDELTASLTDRVSPSGTAELASKSAVEFDDEKKRMLSKREAGRGLAVKRDKDVRRKNKTWKRVKAIPNTTRLMVGDKDELEMNGMQVNVQVDGFRARVLIDCFYYNHHPRQLEGTFKLRLPDDASLYYFAFGQSAYEFRPEGKLADEEFLQAGQQFISLRPADVSRARQNDWQHVKEARMVPREKAADAYRQTVRRRVDPALVEWSGAGVFNARVFPLMPNKLHRIVIGYDVNLTRTDDGLVYELSLPESTGECRVNLNVLELDGVEYTISPDVKPGEHIARADRLNQGNRDQIRRLSQQRQQLSARLGKSHPKVLNIDKQIDVVSELRNQALESAFDNRLLETRYHFDNPKAKSIRLTVKNADGLLLRSDDATEGSFWATRITPDLPRVDAQNNDRAVFMVDTSLSSQPDKFNVWLKLLQATLTNNRDSLQKFSVVFFNIENHFWRNQYVDNTEANVTQLVADCQNLALEGATDLYGAIEKVASTDWVTANGQTPDLFLLSDGAANWGETNLRLLNRLVSKSELGSLFAYQTGMTGTAIANLRFLAGHSGGAVFSVTGEDQVQSASTAHRQRPWRVAAVNVEGGTDVMTAGRVQWIYPGQSIEIVGRVENDGDDAVELGKLILNLEQSGNRKTIEIESRLTVQTEIARRLYGQVAVGQLESLDDTVFDVATAYARYFRITGQTCSLLMLDSEADYQRFDIKPEEDLFVIKTRNAEDIVSTTLKNRANELADPKQQLRSWLARLESMPGIEFKIPTALKLAFEDMKVETISTSLDGVSMTMTKTELSDDYLQMLSRDTLNYDRVKKEADRRLKNLDDRVRDGHRSPGDEALKVMSSLVEQKPGDLVLARDVAFSAMELDRPAHAYHLLRRVASARPNESSIYLALGQCLSQLGQADMAMIFYEVAVNSSFQNRSQDFKKIVATEYSSLLHEIVSGTQESSVREFAKARLTSLQEKLGIEPGDLVVTMMWNTDQTDIDLHVVEPSGEECNYQHRDTRSGGQLTRDITSGFGPEMYTLPNAPQGEYQLLVKYFAGNQNRTDLRSKVYLTIHRNLGREDATVTRKSIELSEVGGKERVDILTVK